LPDPDDDPHVATAIQGQAERLVIGDNGDLLALGTVDGTRIVTAHALVSALK